VAALLSVEMRGGWIFGFSLENPKSGEHNMSQEFVPDENESVSVALEEDCQNSDSAAISEQDVLLVTVVGSPQGVRETILTLYRLGFAQVGDWSPLQRAATAGHVMSVLIRRKVLSTKQPTKVDNRFFHCSR
jgi:hypothetical protein